MNENLMQRARQAEFSTRALENSDDMIIDGYKVGGFIPVCNALLEDAFRDPAGLTEFKVLENYIPYDMSGSQQKLVPKSGTAAGKGEGNAEQ